MAGWSIVADDDAVEVCKTPKNLKANKSPEDSRRSGVSLFRRLLESFLVEFCSTDSFRPLPPRTGDGRPVDLLNLFLNVSHKGGFDSVSENGSWDEVAQESGFGFNNSASAKLIYVKYLDTLARWLNIVIAGDMDCTSVQLSGISDDLVTRLEDFLSEVKRKYELRKGKASLGAEVKWFISKTKRRYDKYQIGKESGPNDAVKEIQGSKATDKECSSPWKRKRECPLKTLKWLHKVSKYPCKPCIGPLPDRSKWDSYGSEEPWKQLLLFRASRTNTDSACEKSWKKLQKMHPSLYDDSTGLSYNLRARLFLYGNQFNENKTRKGKISSGNEEDRPCALVGSEFQVEVPDWIDMTSESNSKWLGTQVWPLSKDKNNNNNLLIERDPIGKGRQEPCGCQNPGTVECVRFHITTKQEKLKLELGPAFYMWCFDIMGEGTLKYWTDLEMKKVKYLMTFPPTLRPTLFDQLKKILNSKSRGKIVSYFYNVTLLQFRANQNRIIPHEVDSDTDQLYNIATENEDQSQKLVLVSPKKKRLKRK